MAITNVDFEVDEEKVKKVVIGASVLELVSGSGWYQIFQCFLIFILLVFAAMSDTNFVFAAAAAKYRCKVPQCETSDMSWFAPVWWPTVKRFNCTRPAFGNKFSCSPGEVQACPHWDYEDNYSVVSEFHLSCQEFKRAMISSIHNLGGFVGIPLIRIVADRWGRKTAVILNSISLCIGALKTLTGGGSRGYTQYVVMEFFEATLVTGAYTSCYILIVELMGTEKKIIASAIVGIAISTGEIILAYIVWNVSYWRQFLLIIGCPGALFLVYTLFLEESMKWLLTAGETPKAVTLLKKIAKWNKFILPNKIKYSNSTLDDIQDPKEEFYVNLLFEYPAMFHRLIICAWWWFSISLVYYGLTYSSVALPGNKYTNFALSGLVAIPGELIALFILNHIGRRGTLFGGCFICGAYNTALKLTAFLIGKMFSTCCFSTLYVYTSELMPKSSGAALTTCSMVARIGAALAPLILLLGQKWVTLPSMLFGCATLLSALLALTTPETLHHQQPNTVVEAIAL